MAKYLDYDGLGKVWEKIKARDNAVQGNVDTLKTNIKDGTIVAGKAQKDASGNVITTTYLTVTDATNTYMPIRAATTAALGGIMMLNDAIAEPALNARGSTSKGGYYEIKIDTNNHLWVSVPWVNDNTTYTITANDAKITLTPSNLGVAGTPTTVTINNVGHASTADSATKATKDSDGNAINTTYLKASLKGAKNGLATLDANGQVPAAQLPSYVDDVIEGYYYNSAFYKEAAHTNKITGESGKIYVDLSTEVTYRWSGSKFVEISKSLAVGTTSGTAYDGAKGAQLEKDVAALKQADASITSNYLPKLANSVKIDRVAGSGSVYFLEVQTGTSETGAISANNTRTRFQDDGFEVVSSLTDVSGTNPKSYRTTFKVGPTGVFINNEEVACTPISESEINTLCV